MGSRKLFGGGRESEPEIDIHQAARARIGTDAEEVGDWTLAYGAEAEQADIRHMVEKHGSMIGEAPGPSLLWYVGAPEDMLPSHPTPDQAASLHASYDASVAIIREIARSGVPDPRGTVEPGKLG